MYFTLISKHISLHIAAIPNIMLQTFFVLCDIKLLLLALLLITLPRYLNSDICSVGLLLIVIVVIFVFLEFIVSILRLVSLSFNLFLSWKWIALSCDLKTSFSVRLVLARSSTYSSGSNFVSPIRGSNFETLFHDTVMLKYCIK